MRWACICYQNDEIKCADPGKDVPTTHQLSASQSNGRKTTEKAVSTLYLATERKSPNFFRILLKYAAKIDRVPPDWLKLHLEKLMQTLSTPENLDILQIFLEQGRDMQAGARNSSEVVVQLLLHHGIDPAQLALGDGPDHISPLSAAMLADWPLASKVLAKREARFPGSGNFSPIRKPTHIPIFAAAEAMGKAPGDGYGAMKLCVESGCDINQRSVAWRSWGKFHHNCCPQYTMPLLFYLGSISSWASDQIPSILDCTTFMLEKGADKPRIHNLSPEHLPHELVYLFPLWSEYPTLRCIELLIDKWGLGSLADDGFFSVIQLLVQRCMAEKYCWAETFLPRYDHVFDPHRSSAEPAISGWRRLLELILSDFRPRRLDNLLCQVIKHKLRTERHSCHVAGLGPLFFTTVDFLADLGATVDAHLMLSGYKALDLLCYSKPGEYGSDNERFLYRVVIEQRRELLFLLLNEPDETGKPRRRAIDRVRTARPTEWKTEIIARLSMYKVST
ncbi:hypothetical protein HRG_008394 [Hirsutella rhossiliensis]|uniref:Ankyrin repeat protein n=1 Tax=Hirsutella rhossiliensis TaxID=111463 RepID=A0A9P8MTP7_9HYPO|nr:uncharacterized protein HRG_08394 [Hirsutella rhossiliensis]KAH0960239.1 hypothetical protein HRG_08394 [Hirsutella rhossiliensis]